jgi:hypothetical protein
MDTKSTTIMLYAFSLPDPTSRIALLRIIGCRSRELAQTLEDGHGTGSYQWHCERSGPQSPSAYTALKPKAWCGGVAYEHVHPSTWIWTVLACTFCTTS